MPGVREQLRSDLRDAMRAKDAPRRNTIRMVEAAIKNAEIEKRGTELAESDISGHPATAGEATSRVD